MCPLSRRGSVTKTTSAAYALYPPVPTNTSTPHGVTNTPTPPVIQQAVLGTGPKHAMLGIGSVQKDSNCGLGPRLWTYTSFAATSSGGSRRPRPVRAYLVDCFALCGGHQHAVVAPNRFCSNETVLLLHAAPGTVGQTRGRLKHQRLHTHN